MGEVEGRSQELGSALNCSDESSPVSDCLILMLDRQTYRQMCWETIAEKGHTMSDDGGTQLTQGLLGQWQ